MITVNLIYYISCKKPYHYKNSSYDAFDHRKSNSAMSNLHRLK